jgi:hypothetical protein
VSRISLRPRVPRWLRLDHPRRRPWRVAALLLIAGLIGLQFGGTRVVDESAQAAAELERLLLPLLGELDATWSAGREGRAPISDALDGLRRDEGGPADADIEAWLQTHDNLVLRLAGLDLRPQGRAVQRQAIVAVTLSRDAVEVLARAAAYNPGVTRSQLVVEATRLRIRSEQQVLAVRASVDDLAGLRRRVSPLAPLPSFAELTS